MPKWTNIPYFIASHFCNASTESRWLPAGLCSSLPPTAWPGAIPEAEANSAADAAPPSNSRRESVVCVMV